MANGYLDVIKGNEGEIKEVFGQSDAQQKGVDSSSTLSDDDKIALVQKLAEREKNIVIMTGKTDYISDGTSVFSISNGSWYLGMVTGTGCVLGTAVSAAIAAVPEDKLAAAIAAILLLEIAAEQAAATPQVRGPGTFVPGFIDQLHKLRKESADGLLDWLGGAKLEKRL